MRRWIRRAWQAVVGSWRRDAEAGVPVWKRKTAIGAAVLLVAAIAAGATGDQPDPGPQTESTVAEPTVAATATAPAPEPTAAEPTDDPANDQSRLACGHFRNVAGDADVLTDAELRDKLKEVHDDAVIATDRVRLASRRMLSAVTAGNVDEFRAAVDEMDAACAAAGY